MTVSHLSEKRIEQYLVRECEKLDWDCCKLVDEGNTGFPDRTVFKTNGDTFYVEVKRPGGKLSGKQRYRIGRLRRRGFRVYVPYSKEEVDRLIDYEHAREK